MKIYIDGLPIRHDVFKFPGGEIQVRVGVDLIRTPQRCVIEAEITSSDALVSLLLATDALRRSFATAIFPIRLVCKYLPYARQDRVCAPGEALSLKVACDLINAQKYDAVEVWDVHSDVALALLDRVIHLTIPDIVPPQTFCGSITLVAPDAGAMKRVSACAKAWGLPMITAEKVRDPATGAITATVVHHMPPGARHFLMVDDICDGGRTFIELAKVLRAEGAETVDLYVTHGIFSAGVPPLREAIYHIYVANPLIPVAEFSDFITQI